MIRIFGINETTSDLNNLNGDCIVRPSKAIVHKYENSDYYLELEADAEYANYFEQNRIVVADLPSGSKEFFRMGNITKTRGKCKCKCNQIFADMQFAVEDFVYPSYPPHLSTTFYDALSWLNSRIIADRSGVDSQYKSFTVNDYTVSGQTDFASTEIMFRAKTMMDWVNQLLKEHGGYLIRSKRSFGISRIRPTRDNGVTIQYGSNLKSITKEEDFSEVCNYLQAFTTAQWGQKDYFPSYPSYSGYNFNRIVRFDVKVDSGVQDYETAFEAKLDELANAYLEEHKLPKIKYTVDAYFKDALEIQDLGDQIKVVDEQLGIEVMTYVLGFDLDLLTGKYNKVEFGNYTTTMKGYNDRVKSQMTAVENNVSNVAFPVGSIFQTTGNTPESLGINGNWTLVSSSGSVNTYRRVH